MKQPTPPKSILQESHELIHGARRTDYGPAHQSFTQIATLWTALLATKLTSKITATEVALLMQQLKVARLIHQPAHYDSILDNVSYGALVKTVQDAEASGDELPGILGQL